MSEKVIHNELCPRCPNNPNAEKPYIRMANVNFNEETNEVLEKTGEALGVKPICVACQSVAEFVSEWERKKAA